MMQRDIYKKSFIILHHMSTTSHFRITFANVIHYKQYTTVSTQN